MYYISQTLTWKSLPIRYAFADPLAVLRILLRYTVQRVGERRYLLLSSRRDLAGWQEDPHVRLHISDCR